MTPNPTDTPGGPLRGGGDLSFRIELLPPEHPDRMAALRLLVGAGSQPAERVARNLSSLLQAVKRQGLRLDLLLTAKRFERPPAGGRLVAAAAAVESPGHTALLFLGPCQDGLLEAPVAIELLKELQTLAWGRDLALLQALLLPGETAVATTYRDAGFSFLAELVYQNRPVAGERCGTGFQPVDVPDLTYVTYCPDVNDRFIRTMEASYVDSLDCPKLTGLRDTSDVLLGHRHTGIHDPDLWFLASRGDGPVGVLLLAGVWPISSEGPAPLQGVGDSNKSPIRAPTAKAMDHPPCLEVVYMGVVPSERGKGIGNALLSLAIDVARRRAVRFLTLAVDSTNIPARRLYERWGFVEVARRRAWIARRPL